MTILGGGAQKNSIQQENKCFLIGRMLKIGPIDFTLEPIRQGDPKTINPTQPKNKCFLIGRKLKIGPIDFTLDAVRQGGPKRNNPMGKQVLSYQS